MKQGHPFDVFRAFNKISCRDAIIISGIKDVLKSDVAVTFNRDKASLQSMFDDEFLERVVKAGGLINNEKA